MTYPVVLSGRSQRQLDEITDAIEILDRIAAERFVQEFMRRVASLKQHPERHGLAIESVNFPVPIREFLLGRRRQYRVLYSIRPELVSILGIYHASRDAIDPTEFLAE